MKTKRMTAAILAAAMIMSGSALTASAEEGIPPETGMAGAEETVTVPEEVMPAARKTVIT